MLVLHKEALLKVGVIGCGRISGHHCQAIANTPGAKLVAVCDLEIEKAELYQNEFGAKAYDNYHKMLTENPDINVVAVITPSGMHYEHTIDIISRYKKSVIVEKPTFMRPSQVISAYDHAHKAGVSIYPVFQNRHNLAVKRVLKGIMNGELGKLRSAAVRVRWCRPQRYYDLSPWRGTYSMDGGCLTNQGIHHIDLLRMIGGEIERVSCVHKTLGADIEVEDTAVGAIEFRNGALGSLEITTAARPIDYEASISLVCENGLAKIGGIAVNELQIYTPEPSACALNSEDFSGNVYGNGHLEIYKELVDVQRLDNQFSVSSSDVYLTIKLLNSFYLADELNTWINPATMSEDSSRLGRSEEWLANLYRKSP